MLRALDALGGCMHLDEDAGSLLVKGRGPAPLIGELDVGSNGTLLRFLLGASAVLGADLQILGDPQIQRRPLGPIADLAQNLGAQITFGGQPGRVPLHLQAPPLLPGSFPRGTPIVIDPSAGTQGASGLLLGFAAKGLSAHILCQTTKGDTHPYVLLTAQALASLGLPTVAQGREGVLLPPRRPNAEVADVRMKTIQIPRDPSALAFALVVAAIRAEELFVPGLSAPSAHPDFRILQDLQALGHEVRFSSEGLHFLGRGAGKGDLRVEDLDLRPDSFPPLALFCLFREGVHELGDAPRLRIKESDRVRVLAEGFRRLGIRVQEKEGGLKIFGGACLGNGDQVVLDPQGDHRMAMVFLLLGKLTGLKIRVLGEECVKKSWPEFSDFLERVNPTA